MNLWWNVIVYYRERIEPLLDVDDNREGDFYMLWSILH